MDVGVGYLAARYAEESGSCEWVLEDDEEYGEGVVVFGWEWSGEVADVGCDACGHGRGGGSSSFPFEEEGLGLVVRAEDGEGVWVDGAEGSVVSEVPRGSAWGIDVEESSCLVACMCCECCEEMVDGVGMVDISEELLALGA